MLTKRAQILFEKELWERLVKFAQAKNLSAAEVAREAIETKLAEEEKLERRRKAIESTFKNRIRLKGKVDYKEMINYGRKY